MQSKRKGLFRSILALLTTLTMLLGMMPMTAFAAETFSAGSSENGVVEEGGMHLKKTATLQDNGTYTINLEAWSTGETIEQTIYKKQPLDIVFVLDQSGSMGEPFENGDYVPLEEKTYTVDEIDAPKTKNYYYKYKDATGTEIYSKVYVDTYSNGRRYVAYHDGSGAKYISEPVVLYVPSESKLDILKESVRDFMDKVKQNAGEDVGHRVAIVGFGSDNKNGYNTEVLSVAGNNSKVIGSDGSVGQCYSNTLQDSVYQEAFQRVTTMDGQKKLNDAIDALSAEGATRADLGMEMASKIIENNELKNEENRAQVVIMFTDGVPTKSSNFDNEVAKQAIKNAQSIKKSATVYTVGVFDGADPSDKDGNTNKYMNYVSSNYKNAESMTNNGLSSGESPRDGYYLVSDNADGLKNVFREIVHTITTSQATVKLNEESVMKDILSDDFEFANTFDKNTNVRVSTKVIKQDGSIGSVTGTSSSLDINADGNSISVSGFDYSDNYVASGKDGEGVFVTIENVIPKDSAVTENSIPTNNAESGIYKDDEVTSASFNFPQPKTILTNKAYVLDYAKPVTLSPSDWKMNNNENVDITGTIGAKDAGCTLQYGNLDVESLKYSPNKTNWNGYDKFYAFGTTDDQEIKKVDANKNGNLWSRVSVLPANNVYYEDDFITNEDEGTVGIVYSGSWSVVNANGDDVTESSTTTSDNNGIHGGWIKGDSALSDDKTYSDGSAHYANADEQESDQKATATFTFTGTGVDIYSRTNGEVGKVKATLKNENGVIKKAIIMDNKSISGDYYQIPTLSFGPDLEHGTYTVTLTAMATTDKNDNKRRAIYYLDGIRVYNPLNVTSETEDEVLKKEYHENMLNATFKEIRDILLSLNYDGNTEFPDGMAVFLDRISEDESKENCVSVSEFENYGPQNEVYLKPNQMIAFKVKENAKYYVGLKAPADATSVKFTNDQDATKLKISHSTDLYYEVTPVSDGQYKGCIVIKNAGNADEDANKNELLAITKIYYNSEKGLVESPIQANANSIDEIAIDVTDNTAEIAFSDSSEFTDGTEGFSTTEDINMFAAQADEIPTQDDVITEETTDILQNPLVLQLIEYANIFDNLPEIPYGKEAIEDKSETIENDDAKDENEEVKNEGEGNVEITNPKPEEEQKPLKNIYDWINQLFHGFGKYF